MRLKITQKNLTSPYDKTLDVSTIRALLVNHLEHDEYVYALNVYNPRCPKHIAKEKAHDILMKDFQKKTRREQNKHRNSWKNLPYGEVTAVEVEFHKVAFANVTKFLIDNKVPFEITDYVMTPEEDMQWEIDYNNRMKHYDNVEDEYERLYNSNSENEEEHGE